MSKLHYRAFLKEVLSIAYTFLKIEGNGAGGKKRESKSRLWVKGRGATKIV